MWIKKWDIRQLNADIKEMGKEDLLRKQDEIVFSSIKDIATEDILILRSALIRLQARRQRLENHSSADEE